MNINAKGGKVWVVWGQGWDSTEVGYISGYKWYIR